VRRKSERSSNDYFTPRIKSRDVHVSTDPREHKVSSAINTLLIQIRLAQALKGIFQTECTPGVDVGVWAQ